MLRRRQRHPPLRSPGRPAPRSNPRWARNDTARHLRPRRQPVHRPGRGRHGVARHAADRRRAEEARAAADRQPEVHPRRGREADRASCASRRTDKKKAEEKAKAEQAAGVRAAGSPDRRGPDAVARRHHVFILVAERPAGAQEHHRARTTSPRPATPKTFPGGPTSATRRTAALLAILNLKTGKTAWADGSFAPPVVEAGDRAAPADSRTTAGADAARRGRRAERDIRWSMPVVSDDGQLGRRRARAPPTTRIAGIVTLDPETGKTKVIDLLHDDAWVREAGGRRRASAAVPARQQRASGSSPSATAGCTSTRSTSPPTAPRPTQLTSGKWEVTAAELSRDGKKFYITTHRSASRRAPPLHGAARRRRAHAASRR